MSSLFSSSDVFIGSGKYRDFNGVPNHKLEELCKICGETFGRHSGVKQRCPLFKKKTRYEWMNS